MIKLSWELRMNDFCQIAVTIMAEVRQAPMPAQLDRGHDNVQGEGQDPDPRAPGGRAKSGADTQDLSQNNAQDEYQKASQDNSYRDTYR